MFYCKIYVYKMVFGKIVDEFKVSCKIEMVRIFFFAFFILKNNKKTCLLLEGEKG
jgi:hypothetical protein